MSTNPSIRDISVALSTHAVNQGYARPGNLILLILELEHWFEVMGKKGKKTFYKFLEPSPKHRLYKEGQSMCEALHLSAKTVRASFDSVGSRYESATAFFAEAEPFKGKLYASYYDRKRNLMIWVRNSELIQRVVSRFFPGYKASNQAKKVRSTTAKTPVPLSVQDVGNSKTKPQGDNQLGVDNSTPTGAASQVIKPIDASNQIAGTSNENASSQVFEADSAKVKTRKIGAEFLNLIAKLLPNSQCRTIEILMRQCQKTYQPDVARIFLQKLSIKQIAKPIAYFNALVKNANNGKLNVPDYFWKDDDAPFASFSSSEHRVKNDAGAGENLNSPPRMTGLQYVTQNLPVPTLNDDLVNSLPAYMKLLLNKNLIAN